MHNRIKALVVAAIFITNTVSPTVKVLANELEMYKVNEEITTTISTEEKIEENMTLDIDQSESVDKEESIEEKTEETTTTVNTDGKTEEILIHNQINISEDNSNSVTKGVKKLEVKPNQGSFDWGYGNSNEVAIVVEFDNTDNKKAVEIELAEGMVFDKYPVLGTPSNTTETQATPTDLSILKDVLSKPSKDTVTEQYNSGKLVYEFKEGVAAGQIVINVSVDRYRYYTEKQIENAITVTVKENDAEVTSTSINVAAKDNSLGEKNNSLKSSRSGKTEQLQPGGEGETYSYYRNTTTTDKSNIKDFTYIKGAELTMYYPENTTLVDVNNLPNNATYVNYPSENKVVITIKGPTIQNSNISLKYRVNDDAQYGTLYAPYKNTMTVTYYDDETETLEADVTDSVEVVDPDSFGSVIEMSIYDGYYHDYNGESLSTGGYIFLENQTVREYNNQVFEYKFSRWNTRKVLLPESMPNIKNIKYKLIGDSTEYTVENSELATFKGSQRVIDADELEIEEGKFFEEVTFEVENIPVGFDDSGKGRYDKFAISFGELPNGVNEGSTTVKIYTKGNEDKAEPMTIPIKRVSKPENIAILSGNAVLMRGKDQVLNSFNQEVLKAKASFDANTNGFNRVYNASNYLKNPEIIIRMPQGFSLSTGTIKLTQNNNEIEYSLIEHESSVDGAKIYTLKTKDVQIGGHNPKTLSKYPAINVEFDFVTDSNVGGKYNLNDMIFIGKEGANIAEIYGNSGLLVENDELDLIEGESEKINGKDRVIARCKSLEFTIVKTTDLVVTIHIREHGTDVEKQPYNKDDESTAIQVSAGTKIDYIVKIENNYKNPAENFEVYIPIPKKGVNMGESVQLGQFNWDMVLDGSVEISVKDGNVSKTDLSKLFEVTYGQSDSGDINYQESYEKDYDANKHDVIKVTATENIDPGIVGEIKFVFKASDNVEQSDVGKLNVFNAYYRRKYDNIDVRLNGNYVGLRLAIGEVKGIAFLDNDRDGLFKEGKDTLLDNITVELFDKSTGTLVATTTTNLNGEYKFEGLANGEYEVRVENDGDSVNPTAGDAKRFTKLTSLSGDSYKNDSDIETTDNINGSISISIPTKSHIHDINNHVNIGFVNPTKITIKTDKDAGTVSGSDSYSYMVWPFTEIQDPGIVTANTGYRFVNYTIGDTEAIFNFGSEVNSDIEIKANFEKIIYKITLDSNYEVDGTKSEVEITFGDKIKEAIKDHNLPTRDGYKLVGWARNQDGTDLITGDDTMGAAPITLYAVWDKAPEIKGVTDTTIKEGEKFEPLAGITAEDEEDQDLEIKVSGDEVLVDTPGKYNVIYTVTDSAGNITTVTRVVTVDGAPVIEGVKDITITARPDFDLLDGITAKDGEDQDVKIDVNKGNFDPSVPGVYEIIYTVTDTAGNVTTAKRVVTVDGAPEITGATDTTIKVGSSFDPMDGVDAIDTEDGNLKGSIVVGGDKVDTKVPGKYTVTYTVTDNAGNVTTVNRIVIIEEITSSLAPDNSVDKPDNSIDKEENEGEKIEVNGQVNLNSPNTGDKGMFSYLLLAMTSMIGLVKNIIGKKE